MVFVKNTRPRLHSIPVAGFKTLQLVPGINQLDERAWSVALEHESVKRALDAGDLEVESKRGADTDNPLKGLAPSKAVRLVGETFDERLLRSWRVVELRGPVLSAIDAQLGAMAAMLKKENGDDALGASEE